MLWSRTRLNKTFIDIKTMSKTEEIFDKAKNEIQNLWNNKVTSIFIDDPTEYI